MALYPHTGLLGSIRHDRWQCPGVLSVFLPLRPILTCPDLQTFDHPSIVAISTFIADTKYPGGLSSTSVASTTAPTPLRQALTLDAGPAAAASPAVALTGLSLRFAGMSSLADLYAHMRDSTELHSVAPFNRWALYATMLLLPCACLYG